MRDQQHDEFVPVTPGENLDAEFLAGYGLSQATLTRALEISPNRIAEIINNRRRITADTALRLGLYFGTSPEFWQNLQGHYDLMLARRELSPETAQRIAARSPGWWHWPEDVDELPTYPEWEERCDDGRRIWATCLDSKAFGVVVSASGSQHYLPSPPGSFHVGIVKRDAQDGSRGVVIHEEWAETEDDVFALALKYRELLLSFATVDALK